MEQLVAVLRCPWCSGEVEAVEVGDRVQGSLLSDGTLRCVACDRRSTVRDGIWRAMGPWHRQRSAAQLTNVWPNALGYESVWRPGALSRFTGRRFPLSEELSELAAATRPGPHLNVVDLGASEGLYARALARSGATAVAVDHSLPFLRKSIRRAASEGLSVAAVQAVVQHLPLASSTFDAAVSGGSLNEIGDRSAALSEAARVLADDGRVFSTHMLQGRTAFGRLLQGVLHPTGIEFDSLDGWHRDFERHGLVLECEHVEGIVARTTLRRPRLT